ncbi:GNAT family N-acetyltransferase [Streptomyces sp. NPDC050703]|uniref:GNAT family N-acetyltransferase n=1 Tax=Streptomyces sp. NPDC050703 TaxID=3157218 RepID=UPI003413CD11
MVQVREMDAADIEAVSTIRVRGWRAAYAGIVPQTYLDAMSVEGDAGQRRQWLSHPDRTSRDLVALHDHVPVGWICFGPCRSETTGPGKANPGNANPVDWKGMDPEGMDPEGVNPGQAKAGEIYALYISPGLTGQGIGRTLLDEAHAQLKGQGFAVSALWVLRDNHRARRFYERVGYQADGVTQDDVYDGTTLTELRYQRPL